MAEVLVEFSDPVHSEDGRRFIAHACGAEMDNSRWQGWIEFLPVDGGSPIRSGRETTQPNRADTAYWATGLTPVYLEGALDRALNPLTRVATVSASQPVFDGPAPERADPDPVTVRDSVMNPFSVYRKGESLLRNQLSALSAWHLVNIIEAYELSEQQRVDLEATSAPILVELIVAAVRDRSVAGNPR
jgi:hypothetical protein